MGTIRLAKNLSLGMIQILDPIDQGKPGITIAVTPER
jgi:hypothetical protein